MDIRTLQLFMETCEYKNISKAAKNLYISQQGLSKAISKLEEEFDAPLFKRTANGLETTEYGELLKVYGSGILEQYNLIIHQIRISKNSNKETLSVGYAEGIFFMLPKNFISNFMSSHPNVNVIFKKYPDLKCEQSLMSGEVDICICTAPYNEKEFKSSLYCKTEIFAVVSNSHPLSACDSISLKDLKNDRVIALSEDTKHYGPFTDKLKSYGVIPKIFINPAEMNIQSDLCSANMAVGFFSGNREHMPTNVSLKPVKDLNVYSNFHLLTINGKEITQSMDDLIDSIQDSIESLNISESKYAWTERYKF